MVDPVVRNIPLTTLNENENENAPKYRLLSEFGDQFNRHLPEVLIIGVKKSGTRALLECKEHLSFAKKKESKFL